MYDYEYKIGQLVELAQIIRSIDLNMDWLISITALAAQEIAIKTRLAELDIDFNEGEDFQKLSNKLDRSM